MTEEEVKFVAFAMFGHYHRIKEPRMTEGTIIHLWSVQTLRKREWLGRARAAIAAVDAYRKGGDAT
jgi:hypothetical protein